MNTKDINNILFNNVKLNNKLATFEDRFDLLASLEFAFKDSLNPEERAEAYLETLMPVKDLTDLTESQNIIYILSENEYFYF